MHTREWQAEDNFRESAGSWLRPSSAPLHAEPSPWLQVSEGLPVFQGSCALLRPHSQCGRTGAPPVSLQHHFYSDSQPGGWEVVSMLHFPTRITDSFLEDIYCPFQPLLLSPLPSPALNPIFFLLSLQMKPLSAPGPLHSCSFYLECFPSRYPRGFCLHLLSIFSYISYSLSCLKQCLILLAYTHLAYKIRFLGFCLNVIILWDLTYHTFWIFLAPLFGLSSNEGDRHVYTHM